MTCFYRTRMNLISVFLTSGEDEYFYKRPHKTEDTSSGSTTSTLEPREESTIDVFSK